MNKSAIIFALVFGFLCCAYHGFAQTPKTAKVILLISEQNIEGPQRAWWASEIDLSVTEATIADRLIETGYQVIDPQDLAEALSKDRAFRMVPITDKKTVKLGRISRADYVVLGKAIASSGGNVPESSMRSCFANITAKLIRVKDAKVLAYLDASGSSAHMDVITGGKEALIAAAGSIALKIVDILDKQGGK